MRRAEWILVGVAILGLASWWLWNDRLHVPIDAADVASVQVWSDVPQHHVQEATPQEAAQIIEWFNRGGFPRNNKYVGGTTSDAGINVRFASGRSVGIFPWGDEIEVQDFRGAKPRYYWLRQRAFRPFFDKLRGRS